MARKSGLQAGRPWDQWRVDKFITVIPADRGVSSNDRAHEIIEPPHAVWRSSRVVTGTGALNLLHAQHPKEAGG